jgi:hypothetical protein
MKDSERGFEIPAGLPPLGRAAAETIVKLAFKLTGPEASNGGRAFYTPEEWRERGEKYGGDSLLVIAHDGGDLAPMCNYDYCCYAAIEAANDALEPLGVFIQNCTSWYSAIYER